MRRWLTRKQHRALEKRPAVVTTFSSETQDVIATICGRFAGRCVELVWDHPDVIGVEGKRILMSPGAVYWQDSERSPAGRPPGRLMDGVPNIGARLQAEHFHVGGEPLARMVLEQLHRDCLKERSS